MNILKLIFASMRISEANIRSEANIFSNMYFFASNPIFLCDLCKYFEANMKRMMQINGVCEYTEPCEYEAIRSIFCLDLL
jgi:hypothetical protein